MPADSTLITRALWEAIASKIEVLRSSFAPFQKPLISVKKAAIGLLLSQSAPGNRLPSGDSLKKLPDFTTSEAGNPFTEGWYADPDFAYYSDKYWIFPTWSDVYEKQTFFDAFSSPDLVNWTKHPNIITTEEVTWAHKAMWAPAPIERHGKYYLYFGANDILIPEIEEGLVGGIGVGVADRPEGPYKDAIGRPLIDDFHNGAQPIDQAVFLDDDDQAYIYYGGHQRANVAKLNTDMVSLGTFDDGTTFKEITPENYVESSYMIKRNGIYYFMWSEGGWGGPDYSVSYAMADSPVGPFNRIGKILQEDDSVARSSGHHAVVHVPGTDIYYIVYHRRPLSETARDHRVTCYDRLYFNDDGTIEPVKMLVKDNFADGKMIAWKTSASSSSSRWQVDAEKLVGSTSGEGFAVAFLDTNFTNTQFDAKLTFSGAVKDSIAGLAFRSSSLRGEQYYWTKLSEDKAQIGITQNGEEEVLASGKLPLSPGVEHAVRLQALGKKLQLFVDGVKEAVVTTEDDRLVRGATGVLAYGEATFDDITVSAP